MNEISKLNPTIVLKLLNVIDQGLIAGLGKAIPGKMCVEAAVCYALGLKHGDDPKCVGSAVRSFKIELNDANWASTASRAAGMRKLAVAQLGSDQINQEEFSAKLAFKTITRLLPVLLRLPNFNDKFETQAMDCILASNLQEALAAANATKAAIADTYPAERAAYAANVGYAGYAAAANAGYAANVAANADYAANAAVAVAAANANATTLYPQTPDYFLILSANLALEVLQEMKSPGCAWLYLCDLPNFKK